MLISRRMVLAGLLAGTAVPAVAEVMDTSPRPVSRGGKAAARPAATALDASDLIAAAKLGAASVAYVLMDAQSGEVLETREPDLALPPASVAKAVTSLYALEKLGAGYRFATRVIATGPVSGGIVQGDIVLAGGGDPTLQTDQLLSLIHI